MSEDETESERITRGWSITGTHFWVSMNLQEIVLLTMGIGSIIVAANKETPLVALKEGEYFYPITLKVCRLPSVVEHLPFTGFLLGREE